MEDFSLIILCQARKAHLLPSTLDTLKSQQGSFEVLVVEEKQTLYPTLLASGYPELKLKVETVEGGLARMMNWGVKAATGSYIQFLEAGDRYISQHGLSFLSELIQKKPSLISGKGNLNEPRFFWFEREKIIESGGFNEKLRFCAIQDLLCRFEIKGLQPLSCPRVLVDSAGDMSSSLWEHCRILYRHFGLKRALNWFFVQNRPFVIHRATRFIKQSFWQSE